MSKNNKKNPKTNLTLLSITAKNDKQKRVLSSKNNQILIGSAGTGKTFLASWLAFNALMKNECEAVVYYRSAVPTRDIGFLPGTEKEKMEVYSRPYIDICNELFGCGTAYHTLENKGMIKFEPTSFVRGKTLRNAYIIVDECQNMTLHELDSIITRLDNDSKIIFCGDTKQADLGKNGFATFFHILARMEEFDSTNFTLDEIVRGDLVKSYLKTKAKYFEG